MVSYGEHVIGLRILHPDSVSWILLFAGIYDEEKSNDTNFSRKTGRKVYILSANDGSWKYTAEEPQDDSWMTPGFDDTHWKPMTLCDFPQLGERDHNRYRVEKLRELGAQSLTIRDNVECIWIRKTFSLSRT
jgi:hypothetical protein